MAQAPLTAALSALRDDLSALSAQVAENEEAAAALHDELVDSINENFTNVMRQINQLYQVVSVLMADMYEDEAEEGDVDSHFGVDNTNVREGLERPDAASRRAAGDPTAPPAPPSMSAAQLQALVEEANSVGVEDYDEHRWEDDGGPHRDA